MTIYAAFICAAGWCHIEGNLRSIGQNSYEHVPFATLAECKQYLRSATMGQLKPGKDGRIVLPNNQGYWECRGRHIDTWESVAP